MAILKASSSLLIGPGPVITFGDDCHVIQNGGVFIQDDTIVAVDEYDVLKEAHLGVRELDAEGRVIIPGIVNAHMHFYSTFARGMALKDPPAENFSQILERLWWKLDKALGPEDCYLSAAIPILQGLRYGVTSYIDHHASPFFTDGTPLGSLDEVAQAVIDMGVRGCLCYEVSDRDGEAVALAGIHENERFIELVREGHGDGRLSAMMGLHAQFTINDDTLEAARQTNDYLHAGFHIHCAEDISDTIDAQKRGFTGAVDRLAQFGILGDRSILAHCIHVSDAEIEQIAATRTAVVHQPTSNMNNAVGAAHITKLKQAGCLVGVGTDGMSANVWDDFRTASWMMRHRSGDPREGWGESFDLLVKGNPAIASRYFEKPVGVLAPGAFADVAVMDYFPPTPLTSASQLGHVLFGLAYAQAWHVVCHGRTLISSRHLLLDVDEESLAERSREHAADLWNRI